MAEKGWDAVRFEKGSVDEDYWNTVLAGKEQGIESFGYQVGRDLGMWSNDDDDKGRRRHAIAKRTMEFMNTKEYGVIPVGQAEEEMCIYHSYAIRAAFLNEIVKKPLRYDVVLRNVLPGRHVNFITDKKSLPRMDQLQVRKMARVVMAQFPEDTDRYAFSNMSLSTDAEHPRSLLWKNNVHAWKKDGNSGVFIVVPMQDQRSILRCIKDTMEKYSVPTYKMNKMLDSMVNSLLAVSEDSEAAVWEAAKPLLDKGEIKGRVAFI